MSWYPGSIFEIEDRSAITEIPVSEQTLRPTVLLASTTDKGPENIVKINGEDFLNQFITDTPSFQKHGQALLQAVNIISAGGELVFKRIVASDATLANVVVYGNVIVEEATINNTLQKMNEYGQYLYTDADGNETTESTYTDADGNPVNNLPVYLKAEDGEDSNKATRRLNVFYTTNTYSNAKNVNEIVTEVLADENNNRYGYVLNTAESATATYTLYNMPLFIITDIGRGVSAKRFQIVPDYESSKSSTYCKYNTVVKENDATTERILFTMNPDIIYNGNNISIEAAIDRDSSQLSCKQFTDNIIKFYKVLGSNLYATVGGGDTAIAGEGLSDEYLAQMMNHDIITMKTKKKIALDSTKAGITGAPTIVVHTVNNSITSFATYIPVITIDGEQTNTPEVDPTKIAATATTVADLTATYGITLSEGTDGVVGTTLTEDGALTEKEKCERLVEFFSGQREQVAVPTWNYEEIYDLDLYKIDYCLDADYPIPVKKAIEALANFREDFFFFEDFGTGKEDVDGNNYYYGPLTTYDSIESVVEAEDDTYAPARSRYVGWYHNYWNEYDIYSKKLITVSITYDISSKIIAHHINGLSRPFAGILYGITFDNAIQGSVNYIPTIVPDKETGETLNRKSDLCELRVNYCTYVDNQLVLETLYTSQENYSQLSFSNNVILVQAVIKAIRSRCPQIRYQFMDGEDLEKYQEDVQSVISNYSSLFRSLEFEYVADPLYESNKIFYATLKVTFRNFIQTEYFKIIALPN